MILVLTYHKVLREREPRPEFYSITADDLERQLKSLAQSSLGALAPEALCRGSIPERPAYLLTFDDATLDHYEVVAPLLARYNLRGIFFTPTARFDRPGCLSRQQARELSQAGHLLGLHSHEHRRLDILPEEDIRAQMERSREILTEVVGEPPVTFAPVGGYLDRRVRTVALESGVRVIRTMRWGYNPSADLVSLDCIPVNGFFTDHQFEQALQFRSRSGLYRAKQFAKRLLPTAAYEGLRARVFRLLRREVS